MRYYTESDIKVTMEQLRCTREQAIDVLQDLSDGSEDHEDWSEASNDLFDDDRQ